MVIVGGGINGAAAALECSRRKISVLLLEMGDVASGTSSRSSRLIHGGLRYLETGQFKLVLESSKERRLLHQIAPFLVRPLDFTWPVYDNSRIPLWKLKAGLLLYDALSFFRNFRRHKLLSRASVTVAEPALLHRGLVGGATYSDAATDDARLTLANIRSAILNGATVLTHCRVKKILPDTNGAVIHAHDLLGDTPIRISARLILNAAGPWSDLIVQMLDRKHPSQLHGVRGSHIAVPRGRVANKGAVTLTAPRDGRVFFVLPSGATTIIGTTETDHTATLDDVRASDSDIEYLLAATNHYFPDAQLTRTDVLSSWAGIRPLAASHFNGNSNSASREHLLRWTGDVLLSILGGKLTTYRVVAADAVRALAEKLGVEFRKLPREQLPGSSMPSLNAEYEAAGSATGDSAIGNHLVETHGSEWRDVWRLALSETSLGRRLHPAHHYIRAEVVFAARNELALTPGDVLIRRTHLAFETRDHGASALEDVVALMSEELGWDEDERGRRAAGYVAEVERIFGKPR